MSKWLKVVQSDVSGNLAPFGGGSPSTPATATSTNSSSQVVASNANRKGLIVINLGTVNVSLGCGTTAITNSGITLTPNGTWVMDQYTFTVSAINAISSTSCTLSIQEYQ